MSDKGRKNPASMGRLEREALAEIAATKVSKAWALAITVAFSAMLAWIFIADAKNFARLAQVEKVINTAQSIDQQNADNSDQTIFSKVFAFNRELMRWISSTENQLFEKSQVVKQLQPFGQAAFASMREGAKEVMIGRDGWLFHRPSFDLLTHKLNKTTNDFTGPEAAIKAIGSFAEALDERGIKLAIMPTWPKTAGQPEPLGISASHDNPIQKPEWFDAWSAEVQKTGAYLYDSADSILKAKSAQNGIAYLRTDSHWNPLTMMTCARDLADVLVENNWITRGSETALTLEREITNEGDLARMLRLPKTWKNFTTEKTSVSEVRTKSKERWLPNRQSPVLLLGDSYSNIFSLKSMGWGEDAGFSEHLGACLGFPVDCILRNGDGANATRAELSAELARGRDRLEGKKLVVWQFSATELTAGNWKPMSYQLGIHFNSQEFLEISAGDSRKVDATITAMGPVPHPASTVYKDYVGYFELELVPDTSATPSAGTKVFAFGLVIENRQWTQLATLRPGDKINVTLDSWSDAENEFGRHQRAEPDGELALEPPNWIRQVEPRPDP
ncbi:MAG: alginate O-acetyltransferase AlgX-related protein [Luteolibacter sp.]